MHRNDARASRFGARALAPRQAPPEGDPKRVARRLLCVGAGAWGTGTMARLPRGSIILQWERLKVNNFKLGGIAAGVALLSGAAQAAPTLTEVLGASGITEAGYVSATWNYNNRQFNAPSFAYGGANVDSFALNQVALALSMLPSEGFGGMVDVLAGKDAGFIPSDGGGDIVIKQAYAQYATGGLTVMGGRFVTLAGSEVIADTGNSNASRSLLFGYQPLTHTGVRAAYKFSDMFTVTGGINNSLFGFTNDNNEQKTGELSLAVTPASGYLVALTAYKGHESPAGAGIDVSPLLVDLVGSFQVTPAIGLGINVDHLDYDTPTDTSTDGVALYANFQVMEPLRLGLRAEHVKTKDDALGDRKQREVTGTVAFAAAKNFDLVTDIRWDRDDALIFNGEKTMVTGLVKGIFKF
jgi:hypothetical protein